MNKPALLSFERSVPGRRSEVIPMTDAPAVNLPESFAAMAGLPDTAATVRKSARRLP